MIKVIVISLTLILGYICFVYINRHLINVLFIYIAYICNR